jgi:hypothetical protein
MKILVRRKLGGEWQPVESIGYGYETTLQGLLEKSPGLISVNELRPGAGPLLLAIKEFTLQGKSIDLLAFNAEGDIAIIECKLDANSDAKRKVIGQVLEYGALLWGLSYIELDDLIQVKAGSSLVESIKQTVDIPDWNEDVFRSQVEENLANGYFMLIIVVDAINDDLARIVRFINAAGGPKFDFAAMEMRLFESKLTETEILVPRVLGPVRSAKSVNKDEPGKPWDEQSLFVAIEQSSGQEAVAVAKRIHEWAKKKTRIWWGKGKVDGSFVPVFDYNGTANTLFAVRSIGKVEIYFKRYNPKAPFFQEKLRMELMNRLNQIDGINLAHADLEKFPKIPLTVFAKEGALGKFLEIYDWVLEEIQQS